MNAKKREDLSFDLSLEKFWFNHQNTSQDKQKIISVSRLLVFQKKLQKKKIIYQTKAFKKKIKIISTGTSSRKYYSEIIQEQIKSLSKFLYEQSKLLDINTIFEI